MYAGHDQCVYSELYNSDCDMNVTVYRIDCMPKYGNVCTIVCKPGT